MNDKGFDGERLRSLTLQKCDGTIEEDGTNELCDLLSESSEARELYWQIIAVHCQLDWELGGPSAVDAPIAVRASDDRFSSNYRVGAKLFLAACVLVAASTAFWLYVGRHPAALDDQLHVKVETRDAPVLGTVAALGTDAKWTFGRSAERDSNEIRQGDTIWLEKGAVELKLVGNSVAKLESPLIASLQSADRLRLLKGMIKVDSVDSMQGLTIETDLAEVVELGTTYSVKASDDSTDIVVFDGSVALNPSAEDDRGTSIEHFHSGEAVRVGVDKSLSRIVSVQQSSVLASRRNKTMLPVISAVADDNSRHDFYNFYEIVPGGMEEDAEAFVDRRHQWNGIKEPMPSYLVGGDYVKTFNDDKVTKELQIQLELARPCSLYVLLDNRVAAPDWLKASFDDTGDDIGVDEHLKHLPNRKQIVVGFGKSIDRTHSIWRREVLQPGRITLGPNGSLKDSSHQGQDSPSNMYGIVAVAHSASESFQLAQVDRPVLISHRRLISIFDLQ
ncbi:MAG: FecR domain-containing protein [Planctomycetales bacterium]|nr:FecR domain-containing protein [Planctomycetales bacterium]